MAVWCVVELRYFPEERGNGVTKFGAIILVLFSLLAITVLGGCFVIHELSESDRRDKQSEREWIQFSIEHHCHVARESSFWNGSTLWQCEGGVQIRRMP